MKSMKKAVAVSAIFLVSAYTGNANAITMTHALSLPSLGIFTDLGPGDVGFLSSQDSADINLPQFNPSLGTLTSASLTITGDFDYILNLNSPTIDDSNFGHELNADVTLGIGGVIPLNGVFTLIPNDIVTTVFGCIEPAASSSLCSASESGTFPIDINTSFIGSELTSFIGSGLLSDEGMSVDLIAGLDSLFFDNLSDTFIDLELGFESGIVRIDYEYSAVPLPASVWFFISGLFALLAPSVRRWRSI